MLLIYQRHAPGPVNETLEIQPQEDRHCIRGGKKPL